MPAETSPPSPAFSPSALLMKTKADTIPTPLLVDAIRELSVVMLPIIESNRAFLESITPVLQNAPDSVIYATAGNAVETALGLEALQARLKMTVNAMDIFDTQEVVAAAEIAQLWGHQAMRLRSLTTELSARALEEAA